MPRRSIWKGSFTRYGTLTLGQMLFWMKLSYLLSRVVRFLIHILIRILYLLLISYLLRKGHGHIDILLFFSHFFDSPSSSGETDSSSSTTTIIVGSSHTNSLPVRQDNPAPPLLSNSHFLWGRQFPELEDLEIDLYARIRLLEARLIDQLPPQLNAGGYEALVRSFLNETRTPIEFLSAVNNELFDIKVLELKANLQDQLFNLFLNEPDSEFLAILRESPFREQGLRPEILEYIILQLDRAGLSDPHPRDPVMKTVLEEFLRRMLLQLQQQGRNSPVYHDFLRYFRNGGD